MNYWPKNSTAIRSPAVRTRRELSDHRYSSLQEGLPGKLNDVPDDAPFEIGSRLAITHPQWWWEHTDEFDKVMRVAADWDAAVQVEHRQAAEEVSESEASGPRRLRLTVKEAMPMPNLKDPRPGRRNGDPLAGVTH